MKNVSMHLKQVPAWRWIIAAVFLFGFSLEGNTFLSYTGGQPTYQEMSVNSFNRVVVFSQYMILLLIIADFGFKEAKGTKSFTRGLAYLALLCLLYIVIIMAFHLLVMLIKHGAIDTRDSWSTMQIRGIEWITPLLAMGLSVLLFWLRFVFISAVVYAVNRRCAKTPYGFAAGIALCLFDIIVYYNFGPYEPMCIFPFEHANLEFTLRMTPYPALNIAISAAYWGVLIAAVSILDHIVNRPAQLKDSGVKP